MTVGCTASHKPTQYATYTVSLQCTVGCTASHKPTQYATYTVSLQCTILSTLLYTVLWIIGLLIEQAVFLPTVLTAARITETIEFSWVWGSVRIASSEYRG